jgi:RNA polymerase sigma-70 factor, ECF subfamily
MGGMSFRAIYDEHLAFVFRTLRRFGVPDRAIPDAAQEVFTVAFRSMDRFEGRSSMRTWLFGIARRVASDQRRSAAARHEVLDEGGEGSASDVPDSKRDVAASAERSEALVRAERLLDALPEEQRLVFALFEIEEWTGAEIAEATEVSVATVHSRLRLAREAIKRQLEEGGA